MHVVIVLDPITSKIITSTALADRLRQEGHSVTVFVPPGGLGEDAITGLGLAVNLPDLRIDPQTGPGPSAEAVADFQARLAAERADLYLIDIEAHEYVVAAVAADLPVGLLSLFFNLWKRPGVPPVHQDVVPGKGFRGSRLGIEYGWLGYRTFRMRDVVPSVLRRNDRRHALLAYARKLGLDPSQHLIELHGLIPFQYRKLETITLNLEALELPGGVHPLNHYVGPMPNNSSIGLDPADQDRIMAEIAEARSAGPSQKLIYAAFGAYYDGDDLEFWRRAIRAVGQRSDWIGVFGLGGRIDPKDLGPLPGNVLAYRWAPQMRILEVADCAVIHAGMTSVYECINHEVPMVVFPLGDSFDQFGTAARVEYHQLAAVGDRRTVTISEIQAMIDGVLADDELPKRLRTFHRAMDHHRRDKSVTTAITRIAADHRSATT